MEGQSVKEAAIIPPHVSVKVEKDVSAEKTCKICLLAASLKDPVFSPCLCNGSVKFVHKSCLDKWRSTNPVYFYECDLCHYKYNLRRPFYAKIIGDPAFPFLTSTFIFVTLLFVSGYTYKALYVAVHGWYEGDNPGGGDLLPFSDWHVTKQDFGNFDLRTFFGGALIIAIVGIVVLPVIQFFQYLAAKRSAKARLSSPATVDTRQTSGGSPGGFGGCGMYYCPSFGGGADALPGLGLIIFLMMILLGVLLAYFELVRMTYRASERFYANAAENILEVKKL